MPQRRNAIGAVILLAFTCTCGPAERVMLVFPDSGRAARDVYDIAMTRRITVSDNMVLHPDEFAGVVVDHRRGLLYVGSRDGTLLAIDDRTGELRWEYALGGAASGVPRLSEDGSLLLIGNDNGTLCALDLETHKPRWTHETQGTIRNIPVVYEGVVYLVTSRDKIYALELRTGAWRWQYEREFQTDFTIHGRAGLALQARAGQGEDAEVIVYTGFDDGKVVAISSGEALWLSNLAPQQGGTFVDADGTPLIDEDAGEIIATSQASGVHGLSLADGAARWQHPMRAAGDIARAPGGLFVVTSSLDGIVALERGGVRRWRQQLDPGVISSPLVIDDLLFVTHSEIGLLTYDSRTGELIARLDTGSGMSSIPIYDDLSRRFYATSNRGVLFAFQLTSS